MSREISRRRFLQQASANVAAISVLGQTELAPLLAQQPDTRWRDLPELDGAVLLDRARRDSMATDFGGHFHRVPAAVLQPRSARDVAKIVRFANRHRLKVAMRGQGHSQYGQTLAADGVIIDSTTLNDVQLSGSRTVNAKAGASWNDVTRLTLARGLTPPALGNTMTLSVGGILSAGGISNSSHLHGAVVDNVVELDVVTGAGDMVTCSARRNRELFELALGGMGQCALVTGARLRLVPAPTYVARRELFYEDLATFLSDARRLAIEAKVEHLGAHVLPWEPGRDWRFRIETWKFCDEPDAVDWSPIEADLGFTSRDERGPILYSDYLQREAASNAAAAAARNRTPRRLLFITMCVPWSASEKVLASILDTPLETDDLFRFVTQPLVARKFTRPFLMLPEEDVVLSVWMMFRGVPIADERRYAERLHSVRGLVEKMRAVGAKVYPPYAPFYTPADWHGHYGSTKWRRLAAGKRKFDPTGALTPGTGMFVSEPGATP